MNIIIPNDEGAHFLDIPSVKEGILNGVNDDLTTSLNLGDLLKEYNELTPNLVQVKELRDTQEYTAEEILSKIIEEATGRGYSDVKLVDKKLDKDGNIISIGLQGKSGKFGGCFSKLVFHVNCSYGETGYMEKTAITEECADDDTFDMIFDSEDVYTY